MSEATPEDVVEQSETPDGERLPRGAAPDVDVPLEADPADAAEQAAEVDVDEDERR